MSGPIAWTGLPSGQYDTVIAIDACEGAEVVSHDIRIAHGMTNIVELRAIYRCKIIYNPLPPCGGGPGWGAFPSRAEAERIFWHLPPPTPTLPHKGGTQN
jgi:hypothetical protein